MESLSATKARSQWLSGRKSEILCFFVNNMSLFIASLNSGSNGNCYYVGNEQEAILVDAGISCRETEKRMKRLGLSMATIKAIFVSHEHSDHISGIPVLAKKYQLPIYITPATHYSGGLYIDAHLVNPFAAFEVISIGGLGVTAFPKFHDASNPHSFVITCGDIKVGVFTDIGIACEQVVNHFSQCHAAFLEANYDDDMLEKGSYPFHLKRRIRGGHGHLSNKQALSLFTMHKPPHMSHLILSHLSKNNNDPLLVQALFEGCAGQTTVIVASRFEETAVYKIDGEAVIADQKGRHVKQVSYQTTLF
jgi:phosphoribosyl 1,2-cyclic phosphodiesterase